MNLTLPPVVTIWGEPFGDGQLDIYLRPDRREKLKTPGCILRFLWSNKQHWFRVTQATEITTNGGDIIMDLKKEKLSCLGEVFDSVGLSVVFFQEGDNVYRADRSNGWQPKIAEWIPKTDEAAVASGDALKRIAWICQTHFVKES